MHHPRLLFLDAYDSFSNNIIVLLQEQLNATVEVIHIDDKRFATGDATLFHDFLARYDGVVAGPGPGDPRNPDDLGLMSYLWDVPDHQCLPVLGICLGFQSLALAFGASAEKLSEPRHGQITQVSHRGRSIFKDVGVVKATQYHSLHVRLGEQKSTTNSERLWFPTQNCPLLEPLAWDLSDSERNGSVLMAVQHCKKPFWGVQYHPESICTNGAGASIVKKWWSEALDWSLHQAATPDIDPEPSISASYAFDLDFSDFSNIESGQSSGRSSIDCCDGLATGHTLPTAQSTPAETRSSSRTCQPEVSRQVSWKSIDLPTSALSVTSLVEALQDVHGNTVMLESGTKDGKPVRSETGRFSIIACLDGTLRSLRYSTRRQTVESNLTNSMQRFSATMQDVWSSIDGFMTENQATNGSEIVPFWGGLVGFISYEAGLETIDVQPAPVKDTHPDAWFVFVERSVVIDHVDNKLYIQSLHNDDRKWMRQTEDIIEEAYKMAAKMESGHGSIEGKQTDVDKRVTYEEANMPRTPTITAPDSIKYADKVRLCQSSIRAGDSYELCLTDQSLVSYPAEHRPSAWDLYSRLRTANPAPFSAYLHFKGQSRNGEDFADDDVAILSSSPERFLSWSRGGKCQFRPIKGTVLKNDDMTKEKAEATLNSDKEQAENLMIVDLIRHDLYGVVGPRNVEVEKLMQVEEYETVFQLVSIIEGQLPYSEDKKGVDVLAASLPPGSMTGAPKKRSCELLREIEAGPRGIYSGVLGYLDVGGGGDFSVIIRTAFQWSDEGYWRLGAGGAVTVLSTAEGEFDEMMAKRASSLRAFQQSV
ncbi:ADC synthase [Delphinella strobiligena]|nr:ADC synthase [Delphinella strobiligena]